MLKLIAGSDNIKIKTDGENFHLFIKDVEVDRAKDYDKIARLAADLYVSSAQSNDPKIGSKVFVPSAMGSDDPVIVIAKTEHGYIVQRTGIDQRFEVSSGCLSKIPDYFNK